MRTLRSKMSKQEANLGANALQQELVSLDKVTMRDLEQALHVTKSAASSIPSEKYIKWENEFGSGVVIEDVDDPET